MKQMLKKFFPASSRTINSRLDYIEELLKKIERGPHGKSKGIQEWDLFYLMCKAHEIHDVHTKTFGPYKGINQGKDVVVIGAGPTLNYYEPINAVHIGVNGVYKSPKVSLDYYFAQDFDGEGKNGVFSIEEVKKLQCVKFVGQYIKKIKNTKMIAPEFIYDFVGAKKYFVADYFPGRINYPMPLDLEYYPVPDNASTIFAALMFALYTKPVKIYIVGCDCSYSQGMHFDGSEALPMDIKKVYENWMIMKNYMEIFYPNIEIISVNPVGLRGFFTDLYTDSYNQKQLEEVALLHKDII